MTSLITSTMPPLSCMQEAYVGLYGSPLSLYSVRACSINGMSIVVMVLSGISTCVGAIPEVPTKSTKST